MMTHACEHPWSLAMQSSDRVSSVMVASSRLFAYFNHSLVAVSCVKVIVVIAFRGAVTDADDGWHSGQLAYYQVNWAHFQGAQCRRWLSAVPLRRRHREERLTWMGVLIESTEISFS